MKYNHTFNPILVMWAIVFIKYFDYLVRPDFCKGVQISKKIWLNFGASTDLGLMGFSLPAIILHRFTRNEESRGWKVCIWLQFLRTAYEFQFRYNIGRY